MSTTGYRAGGLLLACCLLITGCAGWQLQSAKEGEAPWLALEPAALQRDLSVVQRMQLVRAEQRRSFDALLEADAQAVHLAILQLGQSIAVLHWDGAQLQTRLAPGWPEVVPARQLLSDLQYVWWPQPPIQAALPPGWRLRDGPNRRELLHQGEVILRIDVVARADAEADITLRKVRHAYTVILQARGAWPVFAVPDAAEAPAALSQRTDR